MGRLLGLVMGDRDVRRRTAVMLVAGGVASLLGGCRDPLITEDQIRSPFHRYDRVRNQDADTFVRDEFGRARPNVAARLAPR
ncbi:MAG: hypothetical protein ACIAS6_10805 [Phycisphaerales bacterium JB060]